MENGLHQSETECDVEANCIAAIPFTYTCLNGCSGGVEEQYSNFCQRRVMLALTQLRKLVVNTCYHSANFAPPGCPHIVNVQITSDNNALPNVLPGRSLANHDPR